MPLEKDINELAGLADLLRRQMGDSGADTALAQFNRGGAESDARIQGALTESQKDPRDLFDKLQPGILGLGAIADLARGRRNTPGKLQAYLSEAQKGVEKKKADARQKFLDKMAQEEMIGKRRTTALNAALNISGQKEANKRTALGVASDVVKANAPDPDKVFDLEIKKYAAELLNIDPAKWSEVDVGLLNAVFKTNFVHDKQKNEVRLQEAIKNANNAMKNYDTSDMTPDEVAGLFGATVLQLLSLEITDNGLPLFDFNNLPESGTTSSVTDEPPAPKFGVPRGDEYTEYLKRKEKDKQEVEELLKMFKGTGGRLGVQ